MRPQQPSRSERYYQPEMKAARQGHQIPIRMTRPSTNAPRAPPSSPISVRNVTGKTQELEGASLSASPKQYSIASANTLSKLDKVSTEHFALASAIADIEKSTDPNNAESVLEGKHRLAQLAGDIDKLQFNQLDAIETTALHSGKEEARAQRKDLTRSLDILQQHVQEMYERFSERAAALLASAGPKTTSDEMTCQGGNEQVPATSTGDDEGGDMSGQALRKEMSVCDADVCAVGGCPCSEKATKVVEEPEGGADDGAMCTSDDVNESAASPMCTVKEEGGTGMEDWEEVTHKSDADAEEGTAREGSDEGAKADMVYVESRVLQEKDELIASLKKQLNDQENIIAGLRSAVQQ